MWFILVMVILSGPMEGTTMVYQPEGEPVPHRFESLEACRTHALELGPDLQQLMPEGTKFGLKCIKDDRSSAV